MLHFESFIFLGDNAGILPLLLASDLSEQNFSPVFRIQL